MLLDGVDESVVGAGKCGGVIGMGRRPARETVERDPASAV
jgi:hypothetical protein